MNFNNDNQLLIPLYEALWDDRYVYIVSQLPRNEDDPPLVQDEPVQPAPVPILQLMWNLVHIQLRRIERIHLNQEAVLNLPAQPNAARNVPIRVMDEQGHETTETAYLLEQSPEVASRAYVCWPCRIRQPLYGCCGGVVVANVLAKQQQRDDGRVVFQRTDTNVTIKKLRRRR